MVSFNIELSNKPIMGKKEHLLMLRITIDRKHSGVALLYSILHNQFNKNASCFNCLSNQYFTKGMMPAFRYLNDIET